MWAGCITVNVAAPEHRLPESTPTSSAWAALLLRPESKGRELPALARITYASYPPSGGSLWIGHAYSGFRQHRPNGETDSIKPPGLHSTAVRQEEGQEPGQRPIRKRTSRWSASTRFIATIHPKQKSQHLIVSRSPQYTCGPMASAPFGGAAGRDCGRASGLSGDVRGSSVCVRTGRILHIS
jgi:hypothetical protein